KRSMIYIDNLNEFIKIIIENQISGIHIPQNEKYICTMKMVELIAKERKKRIVKIKVFNPIIYFLMRKISIIDKVFGSLVYDQNLSVCQKRYNIVDFETTIKM